MNCTEACRQRKSIRAFSAEVPKKSIILQCLEAASWAPNPTSQQPWQFIIVTGDSLRNLCETIAEQYAEAQAQRALLPAPEISDDTAGLLDDRRQTHFNTLIEHLQARQVNIGEVGEGNFNFHRAPMAVLFATYPCKDQNYLKATVAAMQNFMLATCEAGLGTCWMNAVSICADAIKNALELHPDLMLVDGVAVGYPAHDAPVNTLPRDRLPIYNVVTWLD